MAEFVQLAQLYKPEKTPIKGLLGSEKLDGMRAIWDGGISRGQVLSDVPWANTLKGRTDHICTGLWSRLGNIIFAPDTWLERVGLLHLNCPVEGEMWSGYGQFQQIISTARRHDFSGNWASLYFKAFDLPPPVQLFASREVRVNNNQKYQIKAGMNWALQHGLDAQAGSRSNMVFEERLALMHKLGLFVHEQRVMQTLGEANDWCDEVLLAGGEGLVFKKPDGLWVPRRDASTLKFKPFEDMDCIVVGWKPGIGKFDGMLGSLEVSEVRQDFTISDDTFSVSGFTDAERRLTIGTDGLWPHKFPKETRLRVKFRGRSDDGLPREGRYFR